jgi:hypothetical protein
MDYLGAQHRDMILNMTDVSETIAISIIRLEGLKIEVVERTNRLISFNTTRTA